VDACADVTKQLKAASINCTFSGSTGVMVYMDMEKMYGANVGDSRAVVGRQINGKYVAVALSNDHKPDLVGEKARIEKKKAVELNLVKDL